MAAEATRTGLLDRLVDLFRSKPPEQAAADLEGMVAAGPEGEPREGEAKEPPLRPPPAPRYKGVSF